MLLIFFIGFCSLVAGLPPTLGLFSNGQSPCPYHGGGHIGRNVDVVGRLSKRLSFQVPGGADDPLQQLNEYLQEMYQDTRIDLMSQFTDPLIVAVNDSLILLVNGTIMDRGPTVSPLGVSLKLGSHVALATFVALDPLARGVDQPGGAATERVQHYLNLAMQGRARMSVSAPSRNFTAAQVKRNLAVFDLSIKQLNMAAQPAPVSLSQLTAYAQSVEPLVYANVNDYVANSVQLMEKLVGRFRQQLSPEQWSRSRALMLAGHMPRQGLEFAQIMAKEFNVTLNNGFTDGKRLIYCEALSTLSECLNLLSVHLEDGHVGLAFFNQTLRMHRDLLADATTKYLMNH